MLIQHSKFYRISNTSGEAELIWTVTNNPNPNPNPVLVKFMCARF